MRNQWECLIPLLSHGSSHVLEHKWSLHIDQATSAVSKEGYLGNPLKQHDHSTPKYIVNKNDKAGFIKKINPKIPLLF